MGEWYFPSAEGDEVIIVNTRRKARIGPFGAQIGMNDIRPDDMLYHWTGEGWEIIYITQPPDPGFIIFRTKKTYDWFPEEVKEWWNSSIATSKGQIGK